MSILEKIKIINREATDIVNCLITIESTTPPDIEYIEKILLNINITKSNIKLFTRKLLFFIDAEDLFVVIRFIFSKFFGLIICD